jgi:hypothetical protein
MIRDAFTYYDTEKGAVLIKYACQYKGSLRHGDSALFNRD